MRDFLHCIKGFFHVGCGWLLGHWRFGFHLKKLGVPSVPSLGKWNYTLNIKLCFLQYLLRNNLLHRWMQFGVLTVKRSIFSCLYHYISCEWHCHQQSTMHPEINIMLSHIGMAWNLILAVKYFRMRNSKFIGKLKLTRLNVLAMYMKCPMWICKILLLYNKLKFILLIVLINKMCWTQTVFWAVYFIIHLLI